MLRDELMAWNGKSAAAITELYERHHEAPWFADELVVLSADSACERGATWLLKHYFEEGGRLSAEQVATLYAQVDALSHWESQLHILQSMGWLPVTAEQLPVVQLFVNRCLNSKKKFVKAWAYNGLFEIAQQYPERRPETQFLLEQALAQESGSVKARMRNLLKQGFS